MKAQTPKGRRPPRCVYLRIVSEHESSLLLLASDVICYILYGRDFVVGHAVALRFHTRLDVTLLPGRYDVHELSGVRVETRKTECDVFVNLHELLYGTRVLKLSGSLLLHTENDAMRAHCSYNRISLPIQGKSTRQPSVQPPLHTPPERDVHQEKRQSTHGRNYIHHPANNIEIPHLYILYCPRNVF